MATRKKWKVNLISGRAAALLLLCVFFACGGVVGCVCAGAITDPGNTLLEYVCGYLDLAATGAMTRSFWGVLWRTVRVPLAGLLLGFTPFGVLALPILFAVRGFFLCYAVSAFYRLMGFVGLLTGFVLFGLSALLWLPAFLWLGCQGLNQAYAFLRRVMGDGRYPLCMESGFFLRCGLCAAVLVLCAVVEYMAVPALLQQIVGIWMSG